MRRIVLISGASDGIGKQTALLLSKECDLILCGRNLSKLKEVALKLEPSCKVYFEAFDLLDEEAIESFCQHVLQKYDHIDALINNAGANLKKDKVVNIDLKLYQQMMQINCYCHVQILQNLYNRLILSSSPHIINVMSSCCLFSNPTIGAYTSSKDAFNGLMKILQKEAKEDHVKVSNIYPGGVDTNFRNIDRPDYLSAQSVAKVIKMCLDNEDGTIQEIVMRPEVENNF